MAAENGNRAAEDSVGAADSCSKEICTDAGDGAQQRKVHRGVPVLQRKGDQQEHREACQKLHEAPVQQQ